MAETGQIEISEMFKQISERLAAIEAELRTRRDDVQITNPRSSVDITLALASDDPLAALQERERRLKLDKSRQN